MGFQRDNETLIFCPTFKEAFGGDLAYSKNVLGNGSLLVFVQLFSSPLILAVSVQLALQKYEG